MKKFDRNLGKASHSQIPNAPGIYRFYDEAGELIYIGKAKNLKRRLSQYRNARRCKAHAKMRKIVDEARSLDYEICANELEALTRENQLIQTHRPRWNVVGAFFFLYPMLGMRLQDEILYLCYTTEPEQYPDFRFHGAFRSRDRTKTAFFSLIDLLNSIGHSIPKTQLLKQLSLDVRPKHTYFYGFRRVPKDWLQSLNRYFDGSDFSAVGELALLLLDKPDARKRAAEVEDHLKNLKRFWRHEILPLKKARDHSALLAYPVPQKERDLLFIRLR